MRIVLATFGSLGDLHPVIALGLALQARGHRAAIVTSEYHRERILAAGLGFHPAAPDLRPDDRALIRSTMDERRGSEAVLTFMLESLPRTFADYERAVNADGGADLLVTSDLAFAGAILAEKTGLRWASQVLSPISFLSAYDASILPPIPWLWWFRIFGPRVYGALLRTVKIAGRRLSRPLADFRRSLGLSQVANPFFEDKNSPRLVLAMFSRLLGAPRPDWPRQTVLTGFAFYDGPDPSLPPDLEAFLDAGSPPVVFTLGSAAVFDPGDFFLESARAATMIGRRAVILVGPGVGRLPTPTLNTGIFPYAPFSKLFPQAALVVHQGGSGTTGQAMRAGRPMLIVPHAHDQPDNAWRVRGLGVSQTVRRRRYRAGPVAMALQHLLDDRKTQARAAQVGAVVSHENGARVGAEAIERAFGQATTEASTTLSDRASKRPESN